MGESWAQDRVGTCLKNKKKSNEWCFEYLISFTNITLKMIWGHVGDFYKNKQIPIQKSFVSDNILQSILILGIIKIGTFS